MRRTQLFLEDDLWKILHVEADRLGTTVSEMARQTLREKYADPTEVRRKAMEAVIGIWSDRKDLVDTYRYIRALRKGPRRKQMLEK